MAHAICKQFRELRQAAGWSLPEAEERLGISGVALGSYERGDRHPPLEKVEKILNAFGYTLQAVPIGFDAVRLPSNMAIELRAIADQLERSNESAVSRLSQPAA